MSTDHRAALAGIRRFDQLIAWLRDELDWPIAGGDFEELTFDYEPEDLGIDRKSAARIQEIKRLRPLTPNQPWGIFFVKFEPKQLPVVALRRILSRVTLSKRASALGVDRPAWAVEDLLFVSNYGESDRRQISFAHFSTPEGASSLPTLRVIGWNDRATALHLDAIAEELNEHLCWPADERNVEAWRTQWQAAFTLGHREVITTSRGLSERLARLARAIRERITAVIAIETDSGRIRRLMHVFREALVHDLDPASFADVCAQTITYGLLSARITDPQGRTGSDFAGHFRTNLLLRGLMETLLGSEDQEAVRDEPEIDFDELGILEVVELLDAANMEAVVRDFGDRNPREDPVIHFYESFLTDYDPQKRVQRGVFYTPRPVVSYMVRSVDELLRSEFGLADGLADTSTWREMVERHPHLTVPEGVTPDQDFVQILDPATGTGTFLVEIIETIHNQLVAKWRAEGHADPEITALWNKYVPKHLLTRLHGYELLMAPYAVAHLKISLKLHETGYRSLTGERARVYLTNTLEPPDDFTGRLSFAIPALAREALAVNEAKRRGRFTVVMGNPPYAGHSANKGPWIAGLIGDYKKGFPGLRRPGQAKWLSDDYVKFIRYGQHLLSQAGAGILGLITNHSYLDNPTFRGMRNSLIGSFDRIRLLDLHGNSKKREKTPSGDSDDNVFDIQQGVAIGLFVRTPSDVEDESIGHADLWGRRDANSDSKYDWLTSNDASQTSWQPLAPKADLYLFVPRDEALLDEYMALWSLPAIFSLNGSPAPGIVTTHDQFAISWTRDDMVSKIDRFLATASEEEARSVWRLCSQNQWQYARAKEELADGHWKHRIVPVLYRPFDVRFTVYDRNVAVHRRDRVMRHMLPSREERERERESKSRAIVTTRQCQGRWGAVVTSTIAGHKAVAAYDINSIFALYLHVRSL